MSVVYAKPGISTEMLVFLFEKKPPRIIGRACTYPQHVDKGPGRDPGPCTRPVWGDGRVNGNGYHWCSQCWRMHQLIHGGVGVFRANPASHTLNRQAIDKLTFKDQPLPALGSERPDVFPAEWLT